MRITAEMTKSEIFKAAHKIAKRIDVPSDLDFAMIYTKKYAKRLSKALKYIYAEIKKAQSGVFELFAFGKATVNATYKQFNYLASFTNVSLEISASQFMKRIEMIDASEAIERAIAGQQVRIY